MRNLGLTERDIMGLIGGFESTQPDEDSGLTKVEGDVRGQRLQVTFSAGEEALFVIEVRLAFD
jgi:hypothetical protein